MLFFPKSFFRGEILPWPMGALAQPLASPMSHNKRLVLRGYGFDAVGSVSSHALPVFDHVVL